MSEITDLLDAVKTAVEAIDFGDETPDIQRRYLPNAELSELDTLAIDILPGQIAWDLAHRSGDTKAPTVQIAFRQKLPSDCDPSTEAGNTWMDVRIGIVETVADAFSDSDEIAGFTLTDKQVPVAYDGTSLQEKGAFMSVLTLTYQRTN